MNKRDYELVASVLREYPGRRTGLDFALRLAHVFYYANPNFNPDKFMKECGFSQTEIEEAHSADSRV